MIVCRVVVLISLSKVVLLQLQQQTGCSSLSRAHQSLCSNHYAQLTSHQTQGAPGKRGPTGFKGEKGTKGVAGKKGQAGSVDYNRVQRLTINQMKQGIQCSVGLKDSINTALRMSSSDALNNRSHADSARLDEKPGDISTGAWCGRPGGLNWIQVQFDSSQLLAGVVTQGSPSSDNWVQTFSVACGNYDGDYTDYTENGETKMFQANTDRNSKAFNIFPKAFSCRSIRIIPKSWQSIPCLRMELLHSGCFAPSNYKFYVKSQGKDDGSTCYIFINGVEKSIRRRGFCVVIFDPIRAAFLADTFDTYALEQRSSEAERMVTFLNNAQEFSVIAVAVGDAASRSNDEEDIEPSLKSKLQELGAVGVSCDLTNYRFRDSFAFIGQKIPNNAERPDWVRCQHVKRHNGYAAVHATIRTSRYFIVN